MEAWRYTQRGGGQGWKDGRKTQKWGRAGGFGKWLATHTHKHVKTTTQCGVGEGGNKPRITQFEERESE